MEGRIRPSVRALMAIVALVALAFGLASEIRNQVTRRRMLEMERYNREQADWNRREAEYCRQSAGTLPYPTAARRERQWENPSRGTIRFTSTTDWADEAGQHDDLAREFSESAEDEKARRSEVEARLLFH